MIFIRRKFFTGSFLVLSILGLSIPVFSAVSENAAAKPKKNEKTVTFTSVVSADEIEIRKIVNNLFLVFESKEFINEFAKGMGGYEEGFTAAENKYFSQFTQELILRFLEKRKYILKSVELNGNRAAAKITVREPDFTVYKKESADAMAKLDSRYRNTPLSEDRMIEIFVDEVTRIHKNILNRKDLIYAEISVDIKFIKEDGIWIIDEKASEAATDRIMGVDRIIYLLKE